MQWPGMPADFGTGVACSGIFIDAGANRGDTLADWYVKESCAINAHRKRPAKGGCWWAWPWWLQLDTRRQYCAIAYEANPMRNRSLQRTAHRMRADASAAYAAKHADVTYSGGIRRHSPHARIAIENKAFSTKDGESTFGLDLTSTDGVGSSLQLNRRTVNGHGKKGAGDLLSRNVTLVPTVDAVRVVSEAGATGLPVVLKIDIEGSEFAVLRDLLISGALCRFVTDLFVEWHGTREGDPGTPANTDKVYQWMLYSYNESWKQILPGPFARLQTKHCRTHLHHWS
jgi:FkbM family methyltransferase